MIWESSTTSTFYYVANGLALNGLPTADDFEPLKDQIRAYEEIGGGGEGGRGGAKGGEGEVEGGCQIDVNAVNQVKYECFHDSFK